MRKAFKNHGIVVAFFGLLSLLILQAEKAGGDVLSLSPAPPAPQTIPLLQTNLRTDVVSQLDVGDSACGPCAIFNAFEFGNPALNHLASAIPGDDSADKVLHLIRQYGRQPSVRDHDQPRYLAGGGMWEDDIAPFINDWLKNNGAAAPIRGERLALQSNESPRQHLQKVYDELSHSLAAGFPPVVNLQSYTARKSFFHHYWKWMDGHFVTVVAVQKTLAPDASKFAMWVADSQTGRVLPVFVYAGQDNSSLTASRAERSGKQIVHGSSGYPFLMIHSPKLENILAGSRAESAQTICVLQYIVHR